MTKTVKPGRVVVNKNSINDVYSHVCAKRSLRDRFEMGMNSYVSVHRTGWLRKENTLVDGAEEHLRNEYAMYRALNTAKLTGKIVPTPDFSHGLKEEEDGVFSIVISQINAAAPMWEYARAVLSGHMSEELWVALCSEVGRALKVFHSKGFAHKDLHSGNIIMEVNKSSKWSANFIDFGMTIKTISLSAEEAGMWKERDRTDLLKDLNEVVIVYGLKAPVSNEIKEVYAAGLLAFHKAAK